MIPLTAMLAGTAVIAFSGALGYAVGKMSTHAEKMAENGKYNVTRACVSCKYAELYDDEDPCDYCTNYSEWEPDDGAGT